MTHNKPTKLGIVLGKELARLHEDSMSRNSPERCHDCAFRAGTDPNGCEQTLMTAVECIQSATPFYCHVTGKVCAGYAVAMESPNA